jgi:hypothetical protein
MSGRQMPVMPAAQPVSQSTTVAAPQPQRIRPRQVWQMLTPDQQQQVLGRLVAMCQECLLGPPPDRPPSHGSQESPRENGEEASRDDRDDEHTHGGGHD